MTPAMLLAGLGAFVLVLALGYALFGRELDKLARRWFGE